MKNKQVFHNTVLVILFRVTCLFLLFSIKAPAQNLVFNGSFELYIERSPSIDYPFQTTPLHKCLGWDDFCKETIDYNQTPLFYYNRPFFETLAWLWPKRPYDGDGFIRLSLFFLNEFPARPKSYRDYAFGKLISPLEIGRKYKLSLAHTNGQFHKYPAEIIGHNGFGILLSTEQRKQEREFAKLTSKPQFRTPYIFQDSTWRIMEFEFVADSAYKYITLGNFWEYWEVEVYNVDKDDRNYFYIDDIKLEPIIDVPKLSGPVTLCQPDSVYIANKEKKAVEWWINGVYCGWALGVTHYYTKPINQVVAKYYNDYDTTYVCIKNKPQITFTQEGYLCPWLNLKGFLTYKTMDTLSSYYWLIGDEKVFESSPKVGKSGKVSLIYTTPKECEWIDEFETKDTCPVIHTCFFPNAFSPNNDGLNDTYKIECENVMDYEIRIFNRWGEMIFYSTNPKIEWDGTYKGHKCELGIYLAAIQVTYPSEKGFFKTEIQKISLNMIR